MRLLGVISAVVAAIVGAAVPQAWSQALPVTYLDQGSAWTTETRVDYYTRDQGSRMIPLEWLRALKRSDGKPILADGLANYGYLPNPLDPNGLPVGFVATGPSRLKVVGMTCSACHTREITVDGRPYRVDGGPAIVDFQSLLSDLDAAVGAVTSSDAAFIPFAAAVLGDPNPHGDEVKSLRQSVDAWYRRYHALVSGALPHAQPWGPARLDAVGMIFNRVTGLDIGESADRIIPENIRVADAPVRYPFLWNAPIQDKTQWPGFSGNGSDILALGRNVGEVFGVFGNFAPSKIGPVVDFLNNNSVNFDGLERLEQLIKKIGPPKWPAAWPYDPSLARLGKAIYERSEAAGGCVSCHGVRPGVTRFPNIQTWDTPILWANTDERQYDLLDWTAKTGVLKGAFIPFITDPLKDTDKSLSVLATSVVGTIAEHYLSFGLGGAQTPSGVSSLFSFTPQRLLGRLPIPLRDLESAFRTPAPTAASIARRLLDALGDEPPPPRRGSYESRVLQGIWAAAPYLHNGSVPTLADLLKPAALRSPSFAIGPAYDVSKLGLAEVQTKFDYKLTTTSCRDISSGNSNCGHEYGTWLQEPDKAALLEYLKSL